MYEFCNVHPKGKLVGDCVKRAITKATGMDYMEVQRELNRHKKVTGCTNYYDHNHGTHYIEHVLNGTKMSFPATKGKPRMNGERFCKAYPKGNYILSMAGHLSCCIDGVIYDTWDCSEKCVYTAYRVTPVKKQYYKITPTGSMTKEITIITPDKDSFTVTVSSKEYPGYVKCLKELGFIKI